jgi:ABC-type phosphate transport system auxiliary subunit
MNEKSYKKRLEFQQQIISRQSEQIEDLKLQNEKLKLKLKEKDNIINSFAHLKDELVQSVAEVKEYKKEYKGLIDELRKMKEIINMTVYKGKWWLVKLLIK